MEKVWITILLLVAVATTACTSGKGTTSPSGTTTGASASSSTTGTSGGAAAGACGSSTTSAGSSPGPESSPPGDIPDNQAFVTYLPPAGGYSLKVPEGWARTASGDRVAFTDKLNTIDVNVTAAVQAPTAASFRSDELPALTSTATCFELGDVKTVTRRSGSMILVTYRADARPDAVTGKAVRDDVERYEIWKDGKQVTITLSGPQGADNVDPWKIVTDSFTWT
jgi:hypothetical protein